MEGMMITVKDLLRFKGNEIWSVSPETTVLDALIQMADRDVGALLVLEGDKIAGIISERDFVHIIAGARHCDTARLVQEVMTREIFTVGANQTIEECMQMMTQKHIRHLPVLEDGKLAGLISIGDVVREMISSQEGTIVNLENYIEGRGYGQ
jgi:CBS domain-containing protein